MVLHIRHINIILLVILLGITSMSAPVCAKETKDVDMEVIFQVNKWNVDPTADFLYKMDSVVLPMLRDSSWTLRHIEIRGAASPDGPWGWNQTLAKKRKEALLGFINKRLPESKQLSPDKMRLVMEVPEDYDCLARNMLADNDQYADIVMSVVDSCEGDSHAIKHDLMTRQNGQLWGYLKKNYFAQLRAAHFIIRLAPTQIIEPKKSFPTIPVSATHEEERLRAKTLGSLSKRSLLAANTDLYNRCALLNIKTNLLFDFAYVPKYGMAYILNAQLEYYPKRGHFTPVISFDGPWWQNRASEQKYFQVRNYQGEFRWYIRRENARYDGFYLGAYGHGMLFGVGFNKDEGYQGEGWGCGISGGYVLPLIKKYKHIKLEFGLQVGYFHANYDPYVYGCPVEKVEDGLYYYNWTGRADDFSKRQYGWHWFGPTRVGISISYDLMYRKATKGVSFKWHE